MKEIEKDWREEAAERFKEKQSKGRFKLGEGENTIRILPRVGSKKSQTPFFEYLVHREVGPNKRFVRCGKTLHGDGDCWLCDVKVPDLQNSGNPNKQKLAASLQAKEQFVVQVAAIDTDSGKMRGPFLWTVPTGGARSLSARLLQVLKSTKRDYIDKENGYNLTIERTGTGKMDTIYGQIVADEESSEVPEKILNQSKPFSISVVSGRSLAAFPVIHRITGDARYGRFAGQLEQFLRTQVEDRFWFTGAHVDLWPKDFEADSVWHAVEYWLTKYDETKDRECLKHAEADAWFAFLMWCPKQLPWVKNPMQTCHTEQENYLQYSNYCYNNRKYYCLDRLAQLTGQPLFRELCARVIQCGFWAQPTAGEWIGGMNEVKSDP